MKRSKDGAVRDDAPNTVSPELGTSELKLGDYELPRKRQARDDEGKSAGSTGQLSSQQISALVQTAATLAAVFPTNAPKKNGDDALRLSVSTKQEAEIFVDALLNRIYRQVPAPPSKKKERPGASCPFTGFKRGQFYELFQLTENGKPVVRSPSLRKKGEKRGARFYNVGDALRYMDRLAAEQAVEESAKT
jgi:hypothetical protein